MKHNDGGPAREKSIWDYYAGQALAGLLAGALDTVFPEPPAVASAVFDIADAMIEERERRMRSWTYFCIRCGKPTGQGLAVRCERCADEEPEEFSRHCRLCGHLRPPDEVADEPHASVCRRCGAHPRAKGQSLLVNSPPVIDTPIPEWEPCSREDAKGNPEAEFRWRKKGDHNWQPWSTLRSFANSAVCDYEFRRPVQ